jgi:DNA polymerase (family 10)
MPQLTKDEIAARLREIGGYMRLLGQDPYRARAYENAGEAVDLMGPEFEALADADRLTEIPGIGASTAAVITELRATGSTPRLEELRAELPPQLLELAQVPGLTVTRVRALWSALGITGIADLEAAARAGRVRGIKGFGAKTEQKILEALERHRNQPARLRLVEARQIVRPLIERLRGYPGVCRAEVAGAIRRWKETVGTARLVAAARVGSAEDLDAIVERFLTSLGPHRVEQRASGRARVRLPGGLALELAVVPEPLFAAALVRHTGARAHGERLQALAAARGLDLDGIAAASEAGVYAALGLPEIEIPPELREDTGEIEAAAHGARWDDLVSIADIVGMTHCHSTFSDGRATIAEMAAAGAARNKAYLTITDHSPTAAYAGGVGVDRLPAQWQEIAAAEAATGVRLLRGTESDILADGSLDYPDDVLASLEVIIASIHNRMHMDEDQMTTRLVAAMRHPLYKIWGHALGRLILRRDPIACRVDDVLSAASASRAAIEINGDPYRLDLPPEWIRHARALGLRFVISTDAHSVSDLDNLEYGIAMARRAGVRKHEVLNTLPAEAFAAAVRPAA